MQGHKSVRVRWARRASRGAPAVACMALGDMLALWKLHRLGGAPGDRRGAQQRGAEACPVGGQDVAFSKGVHHAAPQPRLNVHVAPAARRGAARRGAARRRPQRVGHRHAPAVHVRQRHRDPELDTRGGGARPQRARAHARADGMVAGPPRQRCVAQVEPHPAHVRAPRVQRVRVERAHSASDVHAARGGVPRGGVCAAASRAAPGPGGPTIGHPQRAAAQHHGGGTAR